MIRPYIIVAAAAVLVPVVRADSSTDWNRKSAEWQRKDLRKAREFALRAREIAAKEGNARDLARALILLGEAALIASDTQQASDYASQSEAVAESCGDERVLAEWYHLKARTLSGSDAPRAVEFTGKAGSLFESTGDRTGVANTLYTLGNWSRHRGRYAEAMEAQRKGLAIREQTGDAGGKAQALQGIGLVYRSMGEAAKSLQPFREAIEIHRREGNQEALARMLINLAMSLQDVGDLPRALEAALEGLRIMTDLEDNVLPVLNNLSSIYAAMGNREKALEFSTRALAVQERNQDQAGIATSHNNLGLLYDGGGDHKAALSHFQQALDAAVRTGDRKLEGVVLGNMGFAYHNTGDQGRALECQTKALKIREELKDRKGIAYSLENLGAANSALGHHALAIRQLKRALQIAEDLELAQLRIDTYRDLADAYAAGRDFANAYRVQEKYTELQTALKGEETSRRLQEVQARHDAYTAEKQLELLKRETRIRDLELARQSDQIRSQGVLIGVAVLLLGAVFYAYRSKRRANDLLQKAVMTDSLTGLRNRRFFEVVIGSEFKRMARIHQEDPENPQEDLLFFLLDLDHFKSVNDRYGHSAGDEVLRRAGQRLQRSLRASDFVCRWGGEEFLVVVRGCRIGDAQTIASAILGAVRTDPFVLDSGQVIRLTVSVGFAPYREFDPAVRPDNEMIRLADRALYVAKSSGRDRAVGWMPETGRAELKQIVVLPEGTPAGDACDTLVRS